MGKFDLIRQTWQGFYRGNRLGFWISLVLHGAVLATLNGAFHHKLSIDRVMPTSEVASPLTKAVVVDAARVKQLVERHTQEAQSYQATLKKQTQALEQKKQAIDRAQKELQQLKKQSEQLKSTQRTLQTEVNKIKKEKLLAQQELQKKQTQVKQAAPAPKPAATPVSTNTASRQAGQLQTMAGLINRAISQHYHPTTSQVEHNTRTDLKVSFNQRGEVTAVQLVASSGDRYHDRLAEMAVFKASPLPKLADVSLDTHNVIYLSVAPKNILESSVS